MRHIDNVCEIVGKSYYIVRQSNDSLTITYDFIHRRTILDWVLCRWRWSMSIAHISYDEPRRYTMSCDVVRDVVRHRTKFLNMTKNCHVIVRLTPIDCDVVQHRATSHDLPPNGPWSPLNFNARPSHDLYTTSHDHRTALWNVVWCLRYPAMLGITARFLIITKTPKTSRDDPWWLQRRVTSHDYTRFTPDSPWSPKFTHRFSFILPNQIIYLRRLLVRERNWIVEQENISYGISWQCSFTIKYLIFLWFSRGIS